MSSLQDKAAPYRWVARTAIHAIDGNAWVGSVFAAALGVVWVVQTQLGVTLPANVNRATADAFTYWSGRASLLVFVAILLQAAFRAGIDEERERSALSPAHIQDLHDQATNLSRVLNMPVNYLRASLDTRGARNFCQHFPNVAVTLSAWNDAVQQRDEALRVLNERHDREALRPSGGMKVQMPGVMLAVATGSYSSPFEVTWVVQMPSPSSDIHNLAFTDPRMQQDITVCTIPVDVDALIFADMIQKRLNEVREWPEAIRYRETVHRLQLLRPVLGQELEAVTLNHSPGGNCDTCRPPRRGVRRGTA
jgi:hypothetical protein